MQVAWRTAAARATLPWLLAVTGTRASQAQLPRLTLARQVVVDGEHLHVSKIWRGTVAVDGTVYLVVDAEKAVQVIGPNGDRVRTLGRAGSGPGDFRSIRFLGFVGDSVWFGDPILRRVTIYTPDGKLHETRKVDKLSYPKDFRFNLPKPNAVFPAGLLSDGRMLVLSDAYSHYVAPSAAAFPGVPLLVAQANGDVDHLVAWIPTTPDVAGPVNNPSQWVQPAFANVPAWAISPDGMLFASVVASISDSVASARITQVRSSGDTVYSRTIPIFAPDIPDEERERVMKALLADKRRGAAEMRSRVPRFYPPLYAAHLARDGSLLIAFNSAAEQSSRRKQFAEGMLRQYLILDPGGKPRGQVDLPASSTVFHFDGKMVWATEPDLDGVLSLVRYRINPP